MKRFLSITLFTIIILSSIVAYAANGDIIHIGLQRLFKSDSPTQAEDILEAIDRGANEEEFYRVVEDGKERKYINIAQNEREQLEYLTRELSGVNLNDPDEIIRHINDNPYIESGLDNIEKNNTHEFKDIPDIKDQVEANYYGGDLKLSLKEGENYSIPVPGNEDKTTKIEQLKLPEGTYNWKIKLLEKQETSIPFNEELTETQGYKTYKQNENIKVQDEKYLGLYAVNTENKVKAFTSIELKPEMIKQPKEVAENLGETELKDVKLGSIENVANAVKVIEIPEPKENYEYKTILKDNKIETIFADMEIDEKDIVSTENIKVVDGEVDDEFVKYIYVLKISKGENPKILGYKELEITKDNINHPAPKLSKDKYEGPVKGEIDGSTKFTKLDANTTFKYIIVDKVDIPVKDADYSKKGISLTANTDIVPTEGQKTLIGKELLIVAVDESGKVQAYAKFNLTKENVKGQTAKELIVKEEGNENYNYTLPTKGTKENTSKIDKLNLEGIENADKFMYEILDEKIEFVMIDEIRENAKDLEKSQDIEVSANKYLLILATDNDGKTKAFAVIELKPEMIKDPIADELKFSINYSEPQRGSEIGTTIFEHLKYDNAKFHYILDEKEIEKPESGSELPEKAQEIEFGGSGTKTKDIKIFESTDSKLKDENGFALNMMVYAVKDGKVVAYKDFIINQDNVKLPDADVLPKNNYGELVPGNSEDSTMLDKLNKQGLNPNLQYYYKFVPKDTTVGINEKVNNIRPLEAGKELRPANAEECLLILLVDSQNRTKYYTTLELTDENVRGSNANILRTPQHYSEPVPGSENGSTKFEYLGFGVGKDFIEDATKFMVKVSDKPFGKIEKGKAVDEAFDYAKIEDGKINYIGITDKSDKDGKDGNILNVDTETNKYLLLLATDNTGNVKAYRELILNKGNIRGGDVSQIPDNNYELGIGEKPSTTRFTKLEKYGFDQSINWLYKWSENDEFSSEKPYLNQIVEDRDFKPISKDNDILVNKIEGATNEPKYGYILLYAVLNGREIQGYKAIPVNSGVVKEHADKLENISLKPGESTDHTKVNITGEVDTETYKYIITQKEPDVPAKNADIETVAENAKEITNGTELLVSIGQYITVYQVDSNNKIQGYISLPIEAKDIKQGSANFEGINEKDEIEILEGNLNNGLYEIKIKLEGAEWSEDLLKTESVRNALFDGFTVDKEGENWDKVVAKLKETGKYGLRIEGNILTITTTRTDDYDINDEQRITLTIPAIALKNAINPIEVKGTIVVKPTIGATISGSIMTKNRQNDINSGETTIIVKLKDGSFKSWDNDNKQKLIDGFVGNGGVDSIWNKEDGMKSQIKPENIIPQSPQEVKIIIPENNVEFGTQSETISLIIPKKLVKDATEDIVATPRFEIRPDILRVEGKINETSKIEVEAPLYKSILPEKNKWIIDVSVGTVKDNLSIKDIEIAGLSGLKATAKKLGEKQIEITLSGTSTTPISEGGKDLEITIKGSAIKEANSLDSDPITGTIFRQASIIEDLEGVTIDVAENKLDNFNTDTMQYSLNSKTGTDGDWYSGKTISGNGGFKEGKVYIRSIDNKKVFHLVAELKSDPAPKGIKVTKLEHLDDQNKKITLTGIGDGHEYSIDNGTSWHEVNDEKTIKIANNITSVQFRKAATEDKLYSLSTTVEWLDLRAVELNLGEGILENTNSQMEYSFNSTNGLDGDWRLAINGKTKLIDINKLQELEGKTIYIRERKNEEYNRKITEKPIGRNTLVDKKKVKVDYKDKTISNENETDESIDIKIGNKNWTTIEKGEKLTNIDFISGEDIIYRTSATNDKIYSDAGFKTIVPYPGPTPYVEYDDESNKVTIVRKDEKVDETAPNISEGYEFKEKSSTNWVDVGNLKDKEFTGDVVVQIRKSATETEVAGSIKEIVFTKNIDLGKVTLDEYAIPPQLLSTEIEMEYQIFFKGQEPPRDWEKAQKGNTPLKEIKNLDDVLLILIRDSRTKKERETPVYGKIEDRPVDLDGVKYSISSSGISFEGITKEMEYKKPTDSTWTSGEDTKAINLALEPIELIIRDKNYPTKTRTIKVSTRAEVPKVEISEIKYKEDDSTINITLSGFDKDTMEYSLDGGNNYNDFPHKTSVFNIAKNHKFVVRAKAIETNEETNEMGKLPSLSTSQINGIYLGDVGINPMEGIIEATSNQMEYSLNSTNGKDGNWIKSNSPNTTIANFTTGMTVWIREISKPINARELIEKLERTPAPGKENISYDIGNQTIKNESKKDLKYRIAGGSWVDLPVGSEASSVEFKPGDFHILAKGGAKTLDSEPVLVTTIKAPASAPTVEYNDVENKITKINDKTNGKTNDKDNFSEFEYKLPNSNYWIAGKYLSGEEFVGDVVVQIRIKAKKEELPSQIREVRFTGLDLRKVRLSTHVNPHELNGTTIDMEFRITIKDETEKVWTSCENGNTKLYYKDFNDQKVDINNLDNITKIEIRRKGKENEIVKVLKPTP